MSEITEKYGKIGLQLIVAALLIWAVFHFDIVSLKGIAGLFQYPVHLAFFCLCMAALYFLSSLRWHMLLVCQGIALPFWQTCRITYIGLFWAASLLGGMASEFSRAIMLFKAVPFEKRRGTLTLLVDKLASLAALVLWVSVCIIFKFETMNDSVLQTLIFAIMATGVTIVAGLLATLFVNKRRMGLSAWIEKRFSNSVIADNILLAMEAFYAYRRSPKILLGVLGLSLINQGIMVILLYQIGALLGGVMHLIDVGISGPVTILLNMLPISPGGIGVGEVAYAKINLILNSASDITVSGTVFLTFRIITIVTSLPAVLILFKNAKTHRRQRKNQ